jgi:hypothetical protein
MSEVKSPMPIVNPSWHSFMSVWKLGFRATSEMTGPATMDEDIIVPIGHFAPDPGLDDFEGILEALIGIAQGNGRNFLAYLLLMALMHAREEDQGRSQASH